MTDTNEAQNDPPQTGAEDKPPVPASVLGDGVPASGQPDKPPSETQPAQTAPAEYADFQMPEGIPANAQAVSQLKGLAKEYGLTQQQAQRVADMGAGLLKQWQTAQQEAIARTTEQWAGQAKADKELSGAWEANLGLANKALNTLGTPAFRALLNESGLGNHPELLRFLVHTGQALSQDGFVGGAGQPPKRETEDILYN